MTWLEFLTWAEDHGIKDDDEIHYIDTSFPEEYSLHIEQGELGIQIY